VEWHVPVVQKYRCVDVAAEFTKGGAPLYIAMGWDTESDTGDLDLDISMVPFDKHKNPIWPKTVWYNAKRPPALACGGNVHMLGMNAFVDDQSGDEPGDDELIKMDLTCLDRYHQDIEAVALIVNIFKPGPPHQLTWSEIDSAYLRVVTGGVEQEVRDPQNPSQVSNYYIKGAEGVRSYVRLSGNDLKADPELGQEGLVVGLFFKEGSGKWAFGATMKGVKGRNVEKSMPHLHHLMKDLVYPANDKWDATVENQQRQQASKDFAENGILAKQKAVAAVAQGQLPCISSREDKATLLLGGMKQEDLSKVIAQPNPKNDAALNAIKQKAQDYQQNPAKHQMAQKLAAVTHNVENANTEADRKQAGQQGMQVLKDKAVTVPPPTVQESQDALDELDSMFDDM
jgi:stress response protein SCP2